MFEQHHVYVEEKLRELDATHKHNPSNGTNPISDIVLIIWLPVRFALKVFGVALTHAGRLLLRVSQQQMVESDQQPQTL